MHRESDNSGKKRSTSYIKLPESQDFFRDRGKDIKSTMNSASVLSKGNSQTFSSCRNQMGQQISQNEFLRYRQQLKDNDKSKILSEIEQDKQNAGRINREKQQGQKQEERQQQQQQSHNQADDGFEGNTKCKRANSYSLIDSTSNNNNNHVNTTYQGIMSFGVEQQQQFLPTAFRNSSSQKQQQQQSQQVCSTSPASKQGDYRRIQTQYQERQLQQQQQQSSKQNASARNQRNSLIIQRNDQNIYEQGNPQLFKTSYIPASHKQQQGEDNQQHVSQGNHLMTTAETQKQSLQMLSSQQQQQFNTSTNVIINPNHSTINIELQAINIELQHMNKKLSQRVNDLEIKTATLEEKLSVSETDKLQAITQFDILQMDIEVLQKELREIKISNEQRGQQQQQSYKYQQECVNGNRISHYNGRQALFNTQSQSDVQKHYHSQEGQQDINEYQQQFNSAPSQQEYRQEIKSFPNAQHQPKQEKLQLFEEQLGKSNCSSLTTTTEIVSQKSSARSIHTGDTNSNHSNTHSKKQQQFNQQYPSDSSLFEHTFSQEKMKKLEFSEEENRDAGFNKAIDILYQIHVMFNGQTRNTAKKTSSPSGRISTTFEDLPGIVAEEIAENKQNMKFISSMKELLMKCAPVGYFESEQPSLKLIWKFIKKVMEEYSSLKTKAIQSGRKGGQEMEKEEEEKQKEGNENLKNLLNNTDSTKLATIKTIGSLHNTDEQQQQQNSAGPAEAPKKTNFGKNKQILSENNNSCGFCSSENQLNLDVKHNNLIDPIEESDDSRKKYSSLQLNQKQQINEHLGTTTTTSNQDIILNRLQDNMSVDKTATTSACSEQSNEAQHRILLLSSPAGQSQSQQPLSTEDA